MFRLIWLYHPCYSFWWTCFSMKTANRQGWNELICVSIELYVWSPHLYSDSPCYIHFFGKHFPTSIVSDISSTQSVQLWWIPFVVPLSMCLPPCSYELAVCFSAKHLSNSDSDFQSCSPGMQCNIYFVWADVHMQSHFPFSMIYSHCLGS